MTFLKQKIPQAKIPLSYGIFGFLMMPLTY